MSNAEPLKDHRHEAFVLLLLEGIDGIVRASDGIYGILCGGQNDAGIAQTAFNRLIDPSIFHDKSNTEDGSIIPDYFHVDLLIAYQPLQNIRSFLDFAVIGIDIFLCSFHAIGYGT